MNQQEIERIEIDLLLEAVYRRYGYDFRSYARASVERRLRNFTQQQRMATIAELVPRMLHDEGLFAELARQFSVSVTEMFRDPFVYRALREKVVPFLRTFPFVRVWAAGCATGEEVYSLAIVLKESGLYDRRTTIFGTDFNDESLRRAEEAIYPAEEMKECTRCYQEAGGQRSFSEYYHASCHSAKLDSSLRDRITFANHNLTVDNVFGEMNLVFCRNVLIYFNRDLQNRALRLFTESLIRGGFLVLGTKEDLRFSEVVDDYEVVDRAARIYRKKGNRSAG